MFFVRLLFTYFAVCCFVLMGLVYICRPSFTCVGSYLICRSPFTFVGLLSHLCVTFHILWNKTSKRECDTRCSLQCVAVCCSVLQCVAVCCSVLQCVLFCRSCFTRGSHFCETRINSTRHLHINSTFTNSTFTNSTCSTLWNENVQWECETRYLLKCVASCCSA